MGNELLEEQTKEEKEEELQRKIEEKKQKKKKEKKEIRETGRSSSISGCSSCRVPICIVAVQYATPHIPGCLKLHMKRRRIHLHHLRRRSKILPRKYISKNKTPKKVKRIPCDPNKPLPQPTEEVENKKNSNLNSSSATDLNLLCV